MLNFFRLFEGLKPNSLSSSIIPCACLCGKDFNIQAPLEQAFFHVSAFDLLYVYEVRGRGCCVVGWSLSSCDVLII